MRYHLFQKFFGKTVKIKETSFLSAKESSFSASHCMFSTSTKSPKLVKFRFKLKKYAILEINPYLFFNFFPNVSRMAKFLLNKK